METNQDCLRFAVELAGSDFSPKDLPKWRKRLDNFFQSGDILAEPQVSSVHLPEAYTIEDFKALNERSFSILNDIVAGRNARIHSPESFTIKKLELQILPPRKAKDRARLFSSASTDDLFAYKLIHLLREPTNKILRCDAPIAGEKNAKCGRLFYRERRQKFCSTKCTNRVAMRSLRKKDSYLHAERESAHERYEARIKKKDPDREVKRRPRK